MFLRVFVLLVAVVFSVFFLFGCGGGEEIMPGEEIILEKEEWVDPVDIGEKYSVVENVSPGDVISLSTGDGYIVSVGEKIVDGALIYFKLDEDPNTPNAFYVTEIPRGVVVPEGPPIIRLRDIYRNELVEPHNNTHTDGAVIGCYVEVDRVLDYNLLVYVEVQTFSRPNLGNEVHRRRILLIIPKGADRYPSLYAGEPDEHVKGSISLLPYTEMEKIDLPTEIDSEYYEWSELSLADRIIPEGHTFRPYRIASSSYLMGETVVGQNW